MANFLFLNDTSGDYHFGCTCTSEYIRGRLLEHGTCSSVGVMTVWQTPAPAVEDWDNEAEFRSWMSNHPELAQKLTECDTVVTNGEGTILGWQGRQGTQTLLFLLYAAKKHLHKRTVLINHSSFPLLSPYAKEVTTDEGNMKSGIYRKVYEQLDFCAVRDMRSLAILNAIGCRNVRLAADCLPLYAQAHFTPATAQGSGGYVLISGGTMMNEFWPQFCSEILPALKRISSQVMFLFAETPKRVAEDDVQLLKKIETYNHKHRFFGKTIGVIRAKTAEEWLQAIHRAAFFASGRFHHSLAALSVGTPFLVLGAHSPKNQLLQDLLPMAYIPWEQMPMLRLDTTLQQLCRQGAADSVREGLCRMALHNFDFLDKP